MRAPARQRWAPIRVTIRSNGGSTFAESPDLAAPEARIIWRADVDPSTIEAVAVPAAATGPDALLPSSLARWRTVAVDAAGSEHVVLSDGWRHIRLDLAAGSLASETPVVLHYRLHGLSSAAVVVRSLRQFIELCRHQRFSRSLFPEDRRIARWVELLRVHDAVAAGATQREIAIALFGAERVAREWSGRSDSLRSRLRRLVRDARAMAQGEFRTLLHVRPRKGRRAPDKTTAGLHHPESDGR